MSADAARMSACATSFEKIGWRAFTTEAEIQRRVGAERSGDGGAFSGGILSGWFVLAPGRSAAPFGRCFRRQPGGRSATAWTAAGCQAFESKNGLLELFFFLF